MNLPSNPTGKGYSIPEQAKVVRILEQIRITGQNTHLTGMDNEWINRLIANTVKADITMHCLQPGFMYRG